jgi:pyrroloquinoline quinone biosynthesis protein B
MKRLCSLLALLTLLSCQQEVRTDVVATTADQYIVILGIAQDAGFPHIGCKTKWCEEYYQGKRAKEKVISLGLVDQNENKKFLFDATPDMTTQLADLEQNHLKTQNIIDGVFITHAHIGHYTGLMYFGKEALGGKKIPVYAMPRMKAFLEENGPWSQLVDLKNILIQEIKEDSILQPTKSLKVTPFLVPHRSEYSETVGYKIEGTNKSALFIPDIDKWYLWKKDLVEEVKKVDYALLDATFFKDGEIPRPMDEVPHPFIQETVKLFENEPIEVRKKVIFIHLNHTNPAMYTDSKERKELEAKGFRVGVQDQVLGL